MLWECVAHHSDDEDDDDSTREFLRDPTTGSRIYPEDATTVVYRFASNVSRNGESVNVEQTLFEFEDEQEEFDMPRTYTCTVLLPETPVHRTSGPPSTSRAIARRAACYKVCEELAKIGLLDYRLFPLTSNLEAKNEAPVDSSSDKGGTIGYLRKQPDFWINTGSTSTVFLHPIIISDYADEAMQPHSPILILTRQALPDLASFKLFFGGVPATVNFKRAAPFQLNDTRLTDLYLYTVRLVRIITNKPYICPMANMVYFFAPLTVMWTSLKDNGTVLPNVAEHIPWDLVSLAGDKFLVPLKGGTIEDMEQDVKDSVIQDRWVEFTRRFDAIRMRPDLTPLSKPLDSPVREFVSQWEASFILTFIMQREAEYGSLLGYCKARRKNFEGLQDYRQPIIEVSKVPYVLNRLNPTSRELTPSMEMPTKCMCMTMFAWR
jgi:endoribonuclease Dicer